MWRSQRKRCPAGVHREGDEGGEREARDRHEPLGHPRRVEPRHVTPEGLVARQVGTEGEQAGEERRQPEQDGEAAAAPDRDQPRDRHERRQPADEHELLDPAPDTARDEVRDLRRVPVDLGERAAGADRARDGPAVDDQARAERDGRADAAFHQSARGVRAHAYPSASGIAPSARWSWPESGIAARQTAAATNRRRSSASSVAGRRNEISPRRCPVD